jgi:PAS domain S-box-containing protein
VPNVVVAWSIGEVAVVATALLLGSYEVWLWASSAPTDEARHEHGLVALICVSTALYAGAMFGHLNSGASGAVTAVRFEAAAIVIMVHACAAFAVTLARTDARRWRRWLLILGAAWLLLAFTPWTVAGVEAWPMVGLDGPFLRRVSGPLARVGEVYAMVLVGATAWMLLSRRDGRPMERVLLGVGLGTWLLAGTFDALRSSIWATLTPPVMEYGFLAFAGALAARHMLRHREMLERSQKDFRMLIERTPDAVVVARDDAIIWCNAAARELLGLPSEGAVEVALAQHLDAAPLERVTAELAGRDATPRMEVPLRRPDGSMAPIELVAVRTEFDGAPAVVVVARDLAERQALTARMIEMDRMITAGTLSAGLGHEINNPLAHAMLNLDEAQRCFDEGNVDEVPEMIGTAHDSLEHVRRVIVALRTFARPDADDRVVHLDPVVRSAVAVTNSVVRLRARLELKLEPGLAIVGGETRLGQVLTNLLMNAAQAIPAGAPTDNRITVRTFSDGDRNMVEVQDTGEGVAPEDLDRIFDAFFTTKPADQGSGLGLSICRQAVEAIGGRLTVQSTQGVGTTFTASFPAARPSQVMTARTGHENESQVRRRIRARLLIVDDELPMLKALARSIGRDAEVEVASSAAEAIALLEKDSSFNMVLSDVLMPGQTGADLYRVIEARWPSLAADVCFMSGGAFTPDTEAFCHDMSGRVFAKPLDVASVLRELFKRTRRQADGDSVEDEPSDRRSSG